MNARPPRVAGGMALAATIALVAACSGPAAAAPTTPSSRATARAGACPASQPPPLAAGDTRTVEIRTAKGSITLKIEGSLSPIAAGNFVALASCHFYDGIVFHRVVPGFVIQGGDPKGDGTGGPGYTIDDEPVTTTYHRGTVAMARTPAPNSAGSQFYICLGPQPALDGKYTVFGQVMDGMDIVMKIKRGDIMKKVTIVETHQ